MKKILFIFLVSTLLISSTNNVEVVNATNSQVGDNNTQYINNNKHYNYTLDKKTQNTFNFEKKVDTVIGTATTVIISPPEKNINKKTIHKKDYLNFLKTINKKYLQDSKKYSFGDKEFNIGDLVLMECFQLETNHKNLYYYKKNNKGIVIGKYKNSLKIKWEKQKYKNRDEEDIELKSFISIINPNCLNVKFRYSERGER